MEFIYREAQHIGIGTGSMILGNIIYNDTFDCKKADEIIISKHFEIGEFKPYQSTLGNYHDFVSENRDLRKCKICFPYQYSNTKLIKLLDKDINLNNNKADYIYDNNIQKLFDKNKKNIFYCLYKRFYNYMYEKMCIKQENYISSIIYKTGDIIKKHNQYFEIIQLIHNIKTRETYIELRNLVLNKIIKMDLNKFRIVMKRTLSVRVKNNIKKQQELYKENMKNLDINKFKRKIIVKPIKNIGFLNKYIKQIGE